MFKYNGIIKNKNDINMQEYKYDSITYYYIYLQ